MRLCSENIFELIWKINFQKTRFSQLLLSSILRMVQTEKTCFLETFSPNFKKTNYSFNHSEQSLETSSFKCSPILILCVQKFWANLFSIFSLKVNNFIHIVVFNSSKIPKISLKIQKIQSFYPKRKIQQFFKTESFATIGNG